MLPTTTALRYVTPLREGGSLPGLVEAADYGTYVVKFTGAGQGPKVLVAEVIVGELARRLGILVPELKVIEFPEAIGRREPDPEVQQSLVSSAGANLAIDLLPGSLGVHAQLSPRITDDLLEEVVGLVPDVWLGADDAHPSPAAARAAYVTYLRARLSSTSWVPRVAA